MTPERVATAAFVLAVAVAVFMVAGIIYGLAHG